MTKQEMQTALETGFNKQGRHLSESMRIKYLLALAPPQKAAMSKEEYRGFKIEGHSGKWFLDEFPVIFSSRRAAREQVDRCWELRALMAQS